jgi:hypothetical protein
MLRKREIYVARYGPDLGPKLFHAHQSQAAHAGVSARLRRKLDELTGRRRPTRPEPDDPRPLPLFPEEPALASS